MENVVSAIVFPTHVGVHRANRQPLQRWRCFPHTRGGAFIALNGYLIFCMFSPHTWGCTWLGDFAIGPNS